MDKVYIFAEASQVERDLKALLEQQEIELDPILIAKITAVVSNYFSEKTLSSSGVELALSIVVDSFKKGIDENTKQPIGEEFVKMSTNSNLQSLWEHLKLSLLAVAKKEEDTGPPAEWLASLKKAQ